MLSLTESQRICFLAIRNVLPNIVDTGSGQNLFYNPPPKVQMPYPRIQYTEGNVAKAHADNISYYGNLSYEIRVLTDKPLALDNKAKGWVDLLNDYTRTINGKNVSITFDRVYTYDGVWNYIYKLVII